jgi:WD40 repeat protein
MNIWTLSGDRLFTRSKVHHNEPILCYAVNRSGTVLITGSKDMSLKVWQMDTGGLLIQASGGNGIISWEIMLGHFWYPFL